MAENKVGRPSKLTPEVQALVVQALSAGTTRADACEYAGIGQTTFRTWMRRGGEEPDGPYGAFRAAVKKAMATAVIRNVALIQTAAKSQWQAAAWWLERVHPDRYGRDTFRVGELERQLKDLERRLEGGKP